MTERTRPTNHFLSIFCSAPPQTPPPKNLKGKEMVLVGRSHGAYAECEVARWDCRCSRPAGRERKRKLCLLRFLNCFGNECELGKINAPMFLKSKVLTIVGPTASGKTSLSIKLAKHFDGEVISADSRQVYRGIDLLSGKVTKEEMSNIPHHLLDIADPTTIYTADDFVHDATLAITDITKRKKVPIIAGGTFFYVDTLLGKQSLPKAPPNHTLRTELERLTTEELAEKIKVADPTRASTIDLRNRRRLIRSLEIIDALGKVPVITSKPIYDTYTIGIHIPTETLHNNIKQRILNRLNEGMISEAEALVSNGVSHDRMEDFGLECRYLSRYLRGLLSYEEMLVELETKIRQFAKRQMTWLKRDQTIRWLDPKSDSEYHKTLSEIESWLKN